MPCLWPPGWSCRSNVLFNGVEVMGALWDKFQAIQRRPLRHSRDTSHVFLESTLDLTYVTPDCRLCSLAFCVCVEPWSLWCDGATPKQAITLDRCQLVMRVLHLQELVCHVYEFVILHSNRKCQCYKGWPFWNPSVPCFEGGAGVWIGYNDIMWCDFKNWREFHIIILVITIQVPGSSSLQELRRRRLGKLLMAKVVRKSQKSEATAEKNHQNQKVSMNEPFSKTGAQKLDILQ